MALKLLWRGAAGCVTGWGGAAFGRNLLNPRVCPHAEFTTQFSLLLPPHFSRAFQGALPDSVPPPQGHTVLGRWRDGGWEWGSQDGGCKDREGRHQRDRGRETVGQIEEIEEE